MRATLTRIEPLAGDITTFYFQPVQPVHYLAGQWTELHLPHGQHDSRGSTRQFTLSSSPTEPELAVTVSFAGSRSSFKQALRQLPVGAEVVMDEPMGDFVLPLNQATPLVWIAGGIGITPFRSMAQWLIDNHETREITLFHSTNNRSGKLFTDLFNAAGVVDRYNADSSTANDARLTAAAVLAAVPTQSGSLYFISGPEAMTEAFRKDLATQGVAPFNIITDAFLGY